MDFSAGYSAGIASGMCMGMGMHSCVHPNSNEKEIEYLKGQVNYLTWLLSPKDQQIAYKNQQIQNLMTMLQQERERNK